MFTVVSGGAGPSDIQGIYITHMLGDIIMTGPIKYWLPRLMGCKEEPYVSEGWWIP